MHADRRLDALFAPDEPFASPMAAGEGGFEGVWHHHRHGAEQHRGLAHADEGRRRRVGCPGKEGAAAQICGGADQQAHPAAEKGQEQKAADQRPEDGAGDVCRIDRSEVPADMARRPSPMRATHALHPDAHADRERQAHEEGGWEDREDARLDLAARPPASSVGPRQCGERSHDDYGGRELKGREQPDPVARSSQQQRRHPAARSDAGEHGRQHRRERIRGGWDEEHQDAEPDDLQRERRESRDPQHGEDRMARACRARGLGGTGARGAARAIGGEVAGAALGRPRESDHDRRRRHVRTRGQPERLCDPDAADQEESRRHDTDNGAGRVRGIGGRHPGCGHAGTHDRRRHGQRQRRPHDRRRHDQHEEGPGQSHQRERARMVAGQRDDEGEGPGEAPQHGMCRDPGQGNGELRQTEEQQGTTRAPREAPAQHAPEREPRHEPGEHGARGICRDAEDQGEQAEPQHLVGQTGRARAQEGTEQRQERRRRRTRGPDHARRSRKGRCATCVLPLDAGGVTRSVHHRVRGGKPAVRTRPPFLADGHPPAARATAQRVVLSYIGERPPCPLGS